VIKHVMSGVNPQGVQVVSFKKPSAAELDHDFLWRIAQALPERGRIGIFNRSHYEEVVALKVHPEWLEPQRLPPDGEAATLEPPLRFLIRGGVLRVRSAPRHPGASSSALLPEDFSGTVRALLHIAIGRDPATGERARTSSTEPKAKET
jgi:hypothetical protein